MTAAETGELVPVIDTHCHLDYIVNPEMTFGKTPELPVESPAEVLSAAREEAGLAALINPSVSFTGIDDVIKLAETFESVFAAVAIHPTDVAELQPIADWQSKIAKKLDNPAVVAIGETGLDYYHDTTQKALQQECFRFFLELGAEKKLPVIVHDREAHDDVYAMIKSVPDAFGVLHCFSGDTAFALKMIDLGFYISFAGNVTFKKAHNLHEAAAQIPLDKILIETDSPFLSPMPYRGKPNSPKRVSLVAQKIADLRGISYNTVAEATTQNARALFNRLPGSVFP
ncbi:MAG: TatD family hydrolase [Cyanobacteria bacterium P01_H01_bin.74]